MAQLFSLGHIRASCRITAIRLDKLSEQPHISYMKDYLKHITIDPLIASGAPCVLGIPILVSDVVRWITAGIAIPQILADHKHLTLNDIKACVTFAANQATGEYLY